MALKTDYKDDVFSGDRKYQKADNPDGTISLVDKTSYSQKGDTFSAADINATNKAVNSLSAVATTSANGLMSAADKSKLDNLQVGGKNLLIGTNNGANTWQAYSSNGTISASSKVFSDFGNANGVRFDITKNSTGSAYIFYKIENTKKILDASAGENFTISFDFKADVDDDINLSICDINTDNIMARFGKFSCEPNEWVHVKLTAKSIKTTVSYQGIYFNIASLSKTAKYCEIVNLKLERGTVATDWTPAPEDVDSRIDGVDSRIDDVDSRIDALHSVTKKFTISASGWEKSGQWDFYEIKDSLATSDSYQEVIPDTNISRKAFKALQKANLIGTNGQGYVKLWAYGPVPSIDIPIMIIFRGTI